MLLTKDTWTAQYKAIVEKLKLKPSSGEACAIATIQYISKGLQSQFALPEKQKEDDTCIAVRECLQELVDQIRKGEKLSGFASNASAAAGAAGYKVEKELGSMAEFELD
jgi:hypothetical protein